MSAPRVVDPPRTLHVEHCMGTVFTIDIRDPGTWADAIGDAVGWLHRVDAVFSTYREDSDLSRIRRRELAIENAAPDVAEVLRLCAVIETETAFYFTANWDTELDPTGLVKGWAIEQASRILQSHGSHHHAVNGGGDIQLAGESASGETWRVGISNPFDRARVLAVVTGRAFAVATSGIAERGAHIVDPIAGTRAGGLASVTVVGRSLTRVDAYATAAFAMGPGGLHWVEDMPGYEAQMVAEDGAVTSTTHFDRPFGRATPEPGAIGVSGA